jgi:antitoxin component YwqK of YwqJK toxin-antitoxin module
MSCKNTILKTILFMVFLCTFSCKTKLNQTKNNLQEGRWITTDTFDFPYTIKAKYHKGKEKGTWRYYSDGKLVRKEKYKKTKCITQYFYPNGQLMKKGFTKSDQIDKQYHWYYQGDWYFYDENGKITAIKTYEKGEMIKQDTIF